MPACKAAIVPTSAYIIICDEQKDSQVRSTD